MKKLILFISITTFNLIYAGGFDNLGIHSRVIGLGGAYYGIGDASYSVFYNPAGISHLKHLEINSTYSNLFPGLEEDNLYYLTFSGAIPLYPIGNFGLGVTFLKSDNWQENIFVFSYSRFIFNSFSIGGSVKILRWSAAAAPSESALSFFGLSFDAGMFYTINEIFGEGNLRIGIAAQDITEPSIAKSTSKDAKLPMKLAAGISYFSPGFDYLFALDGIKEGDAYFLRFGAEFLGMKTQVFGIETGFYIRGGYNGIVNNISSKQSALNGGFGIFINKLKIDYAYIHQLEINSIGGSHRLSLGYLF